MTSPHRIMFLILVFALIASSLLAAPADAKRKHRSNHRTSQSQFVNLDPSITVAIDPDIYNPQPDPCDTVETVLNGYLPKTVTLKKTDTYLAKLEVKKGASVLDCDLASGKFEVKFPNATLKTYGKVPYVGGWNSTGSFSCSLRVSFDVGFSPPSTIILSNLKVLSVNCNNSPNWLDSSVVKDGLNAIFPSTITFQG